MMMTAEEEDDGAILIDTLTLQLQIQIRAFLRVMAQVGPCVGPWSFKRFPVPLTYRPYIVSVLGYLSRKIL